MKKSLLFASLVWIVLLSACGPQSSPTNAQPPTTAPTTAAAPTTAPAGPAPTTAAPTQSAEAGGSPTAEASTSVPATGSSCTDIASFVADVTIPDYSHFDARETFTKTWRIKNAGTCTWTTSYSAVYARGDALGAPKSIALTETAPGATLDISADMAAPPSDGKYEIFYQLTNAAGNPMPIDAGDTLWALITVGKNVAVAAATPTEIVVTAPTSSGSSGPGLTDASCVYDGNADFVSQMVSLINAARTANGLPALTVNDELAAAAQSHSVDMACNNFLAHSGYNGSTPASRIAAAGYSASLTRENIYAQPPQYGGDAQAAVDWWMGDPPHRDAILNPQVTEIGAGYAAYSRSTLGGYFTVDFGAP